MFFKPGPLRCTAALWGMLVIVAARPAARLADGDAQLDTPTRDPVVARLLEHVTAAPPPIVLVVDSSHFPPGVWRRVEHLVAFRIHRHQPDGTTLADAATYLVRGSALYLKAAAALRNRTTNHEYVWCQLAAVVVHEAAHVAPLTERAALMAEIAQLRRCLFAGHLNSGDGWNPVTYLGKIEARLRKPHEHY